MKKLFILIAASFMLAACATNQTLIADETICINHESYIEISTVNELIFSKVREHYPEKQYIFLAKTGEYVFLLDKSEAQPMLNYIKSL